MKTTQLGALEDESICPVIVLHLFFKKKSTPVRGTLPKDRTAFLPYIDEPAKVKTASPTTIAN